MRQFLKRLAPSEWYGLLSGTLLIMLINYFAYYADDWLIITAGRDASPLLLDMFRALSFPVHLYIELVEKNFWIPVPVLGRTINYGIESLYFLALTTPGYWCCRWLVLRGIKTNSKSSHSDVGL